MSPSRRLDNALAQAVALAMISVSFACPALAEEPVDPSYTRHRGDHPAEGRVEDPREGRAAGDGVYGRLSGDTSLSVGAGIDADFSANHVRPSLWVASQFFQTVGPYLSYRESVDSGDPLQRILSFGATLQPLFIWRWAESRQWGHPFADLLVDSLSLSVGAHLSQLRGGNFAGLTGAEFGLGVGVPLLGRAPGPWLRLRGIVQTGRPDPAGMLWAHLEWQWFFNTRIIRLER